MLLSKQPLKALAITASLFLVAAIALLTFSPAARAGTIVLLTRVGNVQTTYPRNNAFSIGTTSSTVAKLSVYANTGETNARLFEVASSSAAGVTGTFLKVDNVGCIQTTATSTATPVKIVFSALGATSTFNGTAYWQYGSCL